MKHLAWEEFGPVDIFFFESVKRILLGQCSAVEKPEEPEKNRTNSQKSLFRFLPKKCSDYEQSSEQLEEAIEGETFFESGDADYVMTDSETEKLTERKK